eukprot:jgi/Chrzof1/12431/Cz06g34130.t1
MLVEGRPAAPTSLLGAAATEDSPVKHANSHKTPSSCLYVTLHEATANCDVTCGAYLHSVCWDATCHSVMLLVDWHAHLVNRDSAWIVFS